MARVAQHLTKAHALAAAAPVVQEDFHVTRRCQPELTHNFGNGSQASILTDLVRPTIEVALSAGVDVDAMHCRRYLCKCE